MKKVITTVGTSIFENYLKNKKEDDSDFKRIYETLKDNKLTAEEITKERSRKKIIEEKLNEKWFRNNINASAEIKSLIKLKEQLKEEFNIYLLYSDTILSRLSAEILEKAIYYYEELKDSRIEIIKVEDLQVWDREKFRNGMVNLIKKIYDIAQGYWENLLINITGGYKATIPYLTILGQVNKCPIYYIFEDTDSLIEIPYLPIDIKWEIFENYWEVFAKIEHPNFLPKDEISREFLEKYKSLLEEVRLDNKIYISLNPLGEIFWRKYKSGFFLFYAPEEVYQEIKKQDKIQEIIASKFSHDDIRRNKTENKNGHLVYDDGNNPYRIFYFEDEGKIYIYKTFESHEEYEDFLNNVKFDDNLKRRIKENSKLYKEGVK